jgi:hypothetical protein
MVMEVNGDKKRRECVNGGSDCDDVIEVDLRVVMEAGMKVEVNDDRKRQLR